MAMTPSTTAARPREDLVGAFLGFDPQDAGYIGLELLGTIPGKKRTGRYAKVAAEEFTRLYDTKRAPRSPFGRSDTKFTYGEYTLEEYAWEEAIDRGEAEDQSDFFNAQELGAMKCADIVNRDIEAEIAALIQNTTTWPLSGTTGLDTAVTWATIGSAVPISDVDIGREFIKNKIGRYPNTLVIPPVAWNNLSMTSSITDRLKYTMPLAGNLPLDVLANLFKVRRVLVTGAVKNTANEGLTASHSGVWSDSYAFLCYVGEGQDTRTPRVGATFVKESMMGPAKIESYSQETIDSEVVRARMEADPVVIYPEAGFLLKID